LSTRQSGSRANLHDEDNERAKRLLAGVAQPVTSDHILVETWLLLSRRIHGHAADQFWRGLRSGAVDVEKVTAGDLETAWAIGEAFPDQAFSIVDRTSFAVMERLGLVRAASFDNDFAVYRYGRGRSKGFEVLR
jgi:uncharacterized protein